MKRVKLKNGWNVMPLERHCAPITNVALAFYSTENRWKPVLQNRFSPVYFFPAA